MTESNIHLQKGKSVISLNKEQLAAVKTTKGNLLIVASAGTGKTTTIVERYVKLVTEHGYKPDEILMTTFTNKAAKDMLQKIQARTEKVPKYIGTMHSLFLRMLRNHPGLVSKQISTIIDDSDRKKIIKQVLSEKGIDAKSGNADYVLRRISKFKNLGISADYLESGIPTGAEKELKELDEDEVSFVSSKFKAAVPEVYKKYESRLKANRAIDLDDILLLTLKLLDEHKDIAELYKRQFKFIMVDEAQDLNRVQMNILNLLQNENLCLIGDDCQNIYEWRGSSNDLVFKFNEHYNTIVLKDNYRSTEKIIQAINKTITAMKFKIKKELNCTKQIGSKISVEPFYSFDEETDYLACEVKKLLRDKTEKDEIAILFRTNSIGRDIERKFLKNKIPCHLSKSKYFFERKEVKDVLSYLRLKVNGESMLDFERVVLLLEGIGKAKINKFEELATKYNCPIIEVLNHASELKFNDKIIDKLTGLKSVLEDEKRNPIDAFMNFFNYKKVLVVKRKDNHSDIEKKFEDINVLKELLKGHEHNPAGIRAFLDSLIDIERNEKSGNTVTLSTIHSAKGLEWKHVFLACCNDGILPYHNGNLNSVAKDRELRLFYVAISRAKDFLTLTHSGFKDWREMSPSSFLDIIN